MSHGGGEEVRKVPKSVIYYMYLNGTKYVKTKSGTVQIIGQFITTI